jgi:D-alanyl-lipoteichoic acid acyltransferase DltB (MBOAT superfamily)
MSFLTLRFFTFFLIVYLVYCLLRHKQQNILLLLASYIFYCLWDWRFSFLLLVPTITDYFCGLRIEACLAPAEKKRYLTLSLAVNLSVLIFFKSFNFFIAELSQLLISFGFNAAMFNLSVILPLGISFYTFKSLSYTIDIYRGQIKPVNNFLDYALFVSFFPSLLAGPIERGSNFLPQIQNKRQITWENIRLGAYLISWGAFKKVFIADNLALMAQDILLHPFVHSRSELLVALYAAAFRLYCDISGYTDMARGLAKFMGFDLSINFRLPYFSRNISEYWRKWHMSMTYWFRDYVFFPVLANTKGNAYLSSFITLLCISLWHSISWESVWRGVYYGLAVCIYQFYKKKLCVADPAKVGRFRSLVSAAVSRITTFHVVCIGGLFYYNYSVESVFELIVKIIGGLNMHDFIASFRNLSVYIWVLLVVEIMQAVRSDEFIVMKANVVLKALFYWLIFWGVFGGAGGLGNPFIYFRF